MSARAIREYYGKQLIARHLNGMSDGKSAASNQSVLVTPSTTDLDSLPLNHPWLLHTKLVVKPDQLIKRRGKLGLIGIGLDWPEVKEWISERRQKEIQIDKVSGVLDHFIIDKYVPHNLELDEYYLCIRSNRDGEEILFSDCGGINVGDVDSKAKRLQIDIDDDSLSPARLLNKSSSLLDGDIPHGRKERLALFVSNLLKVYRKLNFTYMEMNPIVYCDCDDTIIPVDLAAKIDETASFLNANPSDWGDIDFPPPFGRKGTCLLL